MNISDRIKDERTKRGYSQEFVAEYLHISRTTISKWENGKGTPDIESLQLLSKLFNTTIDNMLSDDISIDDCVDNAQEVNTEKAIKVKPPLSFEELLIFVILIVSCLIPFIGIIVDGYILLKWRKSKVIILIAIICLIINIFSLYAWLNTLFFKYGVSEIQKIG